ncbi:MAG TPA: enolase C-terminal domain-like protein [Hyphomicrobiaceae bacterium]|jgi:L-alanine-DL-glutamate epimerase-like enolase superfamily enzyme
MRNDANIEHIQTRAFRIPTDAVEADGTISWNATALVVVEIVAGGKSGLGCTYAGRATAAVVEDVLKGVVLGEDAFAVPKLWSGMVGAVRNLGWRGACACAISAVDIALWDLQARLLDIPLARLLGQARDRVAIYGSGGFTSYHVDRLQAQLARWVEQDGCAWVKMKVGSSPEDDLARVRAARAAIGGAELYVDANGAYTPKQALQFAHAFADVGVRWFEEPVSSDDLDGLRLIRDHGPPGMEVAAGEYGYEPFYFRRMLEAGAVDVLQADATRCGGYTGFLKAATLADAWSLPLSAHTAPALHLPVCCAAPRVRNVEWFHDHARIERMVFEGAPVPRGGFIEPDLNQPGHGLTFKESEAMRLAA